MRIRRPVSQVESRAIKACHLKKVNTDTTESENKILQIKKPVKLDH